MLPPQNGLRFHLNPILKYAFYSITRESLVLNMGMVGILALNYCLEFLILDFQLLIAKRILLFLQYSNFVILTPRLSTLNFQKTIC